MGMSKITKAVENILTELGFDLNDPDFKKTPERVERMYKEMCYGVTAPAAVEIQDILKTKFPTSYEGIVIIKNIKTYSLCPHHLLPVKYRVDVGYIADKTCVGLSKIPRLVKLLANQPILQESLTKRITNILDNELKTKGSICKIEGLHTCMQARGVKAMGSSAITWSATGKFLNPDKNKNPKAEFLATI